MVNITNYRDALAPAIAALEDEQARLVLADFLSRAWVATAYQWINEDKAGVRMAQSFIIQEKPSGRAGFKTVIWPVPALAGVGVAVPVIQFTIGVLAAPEVIAVAGVVGGVALGFAIYEAVAVPGNIGSQRLGQSGRLCPDQPRLHLPTNFGLGGMVVDYVIHLAHSHTDTAEPEPDKQDSKITVYRVGHPRGLYWALSNPTLDRDHFIHYGIPSKNNSGNPIYQGYVLESGRESSWIMQPSREPENMGGALLENGFNEVKIIKPGAVLGIERLPDVETGFFNSWP